MTPLIRPGSDAAVVAAVDVGAVVAATGVDAAVAGMSAVAVVGCIGTAAASLGVAAGTGAGVAAVGVADTVERGLTDCGLAAPISRASGATPNGAAGVVGVVGVGLTEPASVPTVSVLVAAVATAGVGAVAGFGGGVDCAGAELGPGAAAAVVGRASVWAGLLGDGAALDEVGWTAVTARAELGEPAAALFVDLGALALGASEDVAVSSRAVAVAVCPADPALVIDGPMAAEPSAAWEVELVTGFGVFVVASLSAPAGLVDFVDGDVSASACARPAPEATARPSVKVAAPEPSHL